MNEKYSELGEITKATAVCMTINGEQEGNKFKTLQCGAIDWCGTSGMTNDDPYTITCEENGVSPEEENATRTII